MSVLGDAPTYTLIRDYVCYVNFLKVEVYVPVYRVYLIFNVGLLI